MVEACIASALPGLDEGIAGYIGAMLDDDPRQSGDELAEGIGPFLQSAGFAESDEDVARACAALAAALAAEFGGEDASAAASAAGEGELPRLLDAPVDMPDAELDDRDCLTRFAAHHRDVFNKEILSKMKKLQCPR